METFGALSEQHSLLRSSSAVTSGIQRNRTNYNRDLIMRSHLEARVTDRLLFGLPAVGRQMYGERRSPIKSNLHEETSELSSVSTLISPQSY